MLAGAGWVGARTAWRAIERQPEFRLDLTALSLGGTPQHVNGEALGRELAAELEALPSNTTIFDRDATRAVYEQLRRSPWLLEVSEVRRQLPNTLTIKARFRKPLAFARWRDRLYMIDRDGYRLPEALFRPPTSWQRQPVPVVTDELIHQPPPVGLPWDEPRMAVGARLVDYLRRRGVLNKIEIATVDVTGVDRGTTDPDIILTTASGTEIRWGPSTTIYPELGLPVHPDDVSDAAKVRILLTKIEEYPGLRGAAYIDLRVNNQIIFSPGAEPGSR
jgi:hypothetical protein